MVLYEGERRREYLPEAKIRSQVNIKGGSIISRRQKGPNRYQTSINLRRVSNWNREEKQGWETYYIYRNTKEGFLRYFSSSTPPTHPRLGVS